MASFAQLGRSPASVQHARSPAVVHRCSTSAARPARHASPHAYASAERSLTPLRASQRSSVSCRSSPTEVSTITAKPTTSLDIPAGAARYRFVAPEYVTRPGQMLKVVGSLPELGAWSVADAPAMEWCEGHKWSRSIDIDTSKAPFEFKLVVVNGDNVRWEKGDNRVVLEGAVAEGCYTKVRCRFDFPSLMEYLPLNPDGTIIESKVEHAPTTSAETLRELEAALPSSYSSDEEEAKPASASASASVVASAEKLAAEIPEGADSEVAEGAGEEEEEEEQVPKVNALQKFFGMDPERPANGFLWNFFKR